MPDEGADPGPDTRRVEGSRPLTGGAFDPPPSPPRPSPPPPSPRRPPPSPAAPTMLATRPAPNHARPPTNAEAGHLLPMHPLTVADILDGAFRTWRAVFGPIALLVLLVVAPYELVSNLFLSLQAPELFPQGGFLGAADELELGSLGLVLLVSLVGMVVSVFVATAVISLVVRVDRGGQPQVATALREAFRPFGVALAALLLLSVLAVVGLVAAAVLAIIPILGLLVLVFTMPVLIGAGVALMALVVPVAVVDQRGPIGTITRAVWVLRVRFWRTIGITWLMLIVLSGVSLGLAMLLDFAAVMAGPVDWVVMSVSGVLISVVQIPVLSLAALLVHLDARILHEAFDLEVRVSRLAAS